MNTDILLFLGTFYKTSKTYQTGTYPLKNMYQRFNNEYLTEEQFDLEMDKLGFRKKNGLYKLRENRKRIWGKGGLMEN